MIDPRLGRHFLRRLRHRAEADAIDRAVESGILADKLHGVEGQQIRSFAPGPLTLGPLAAGRSPARIACMMAGHARSGSTSRNAVVGEEHGFTFTWDKPGGKRGTPGGSASAGDTADDIQACSGTRQGKAAARPTEESAPDTASLLRAVRRAAEPLRATDVATLLLVAEGLHQSRTSVEAMLAVLRLPSPIVTVIGRVKGFEHAFIDLLCRGLVLPGRAAVCNGHELSRSNDFRFYRAPDGCREVITFEGGRYDADVPERTDRQIGLAAASIHPILGIAERDRLLPRQLQQAAQFHLTCGPISMEIVRETMRAILGEVSVGDLGPDHASALNLSDLALAIRPGMPAARVLDLLEDLARTRLSSTKEGEGADASSQGTSGRASGSTSSGVTAKSNRGNPGSGGERIEPVALTGAASDRFIPRVEILTGYGEARDWALSLKDDLALWKAGRLAWQDMSVKLLLSGPPGTGKTSFARALCNTLEVPLIVSSVATWLEPGYLGDVLKRMSAAFAEAEAAKPAILFVDEIDGIGRRGNAGEWTSYWNSVVNRKAFLPRSSTTTTSVCPAGPTIVVVGGSGLRWSACFQGCGLAKSCGSALTISKPLMGLMLSSCAGRMRLELCSADGVRLTTRACAKAALRSRRTVAQMA